MSFDNNEDKKNLNNNSNQEIGALSSLKIDNSIVLSNIDEEMKSSYLSYAMSVIMSRAIPEVRDGLKPVHRRILFSMNEIGCNWNRAYKKSARIVGDVMGKYHPHGDSAIYEALVRMGQDFSMGYKLIDGQGNFGSIDGDQAAAMRYTEARLSKLSSLMFNDLEKNTIDFKDNYDGTEKEPSVLPVPFPNILVNGSEGIAVGMATNMPTHNITEIIEATIAYLKNEDLTDEELLTIVPAPDFPTKGIIINKSVAARAILTGRGSIKVRGRVEIEKSKNEKESIIITEIPYQVNKATMIEKIAELVKDKKIEGITNIRDESNQQGIRVVIELKKGTIADVVLNHLYKFTPLQSSFAVNMLCINNGKPETMNLRKILKAFLNFRQEVVRRRIIFLLTEARNKAHVSIGFCVAIDFIDKVISIIRGSQDANDAKEKLLAQTWAANEGIIRIINLVSERENSVIDGEFKFTEKQVKAIVEMRLSRLTGLERNAIVEEIEKLGIEIQNYLKILSSKEEIIKIIIEELEQIKQEYYLPRRTEVLGIDDEDFNAEDFIEKEDVIVSLTANGYIKRTKIDSYTSQNRGGKGKSGMATNDEDEVIATLIVNTHDFILFFTTENKVYRMKAYKIPETAANTRGRAVVNLLNLTENEKVQKILNIPYNCDQNNLSIIFATKNGKIRRSSMDNFENISVNGKIAIELDDNDKLIGIELAKENQNVLLATKYGMCTRFNMSEELRIIKSRKSDGVIGMDLKDNDEIVSLCIIENGDEGSEIRKAYLRLDDEFRFDIKNDKIQDLEILEKIAKIKEETGVEISLHQVKNLAKEEEILLTVSDDGYGKKTSSYHYRISGRGGKGVKNMNLDNNTVVGVRPIKEDNDIILMSTKGQTIRIPCGSISIVGRNTKGVKLFNIDKDEKVASFSVC